MVRDPAASMDIAGQVLQPFPLGIDPIRTPASIIDTAAGDLKGPK